MPMTYLRLAFSTSQHANIRKRRTSIARARAAIFDVLLSSFHGPQFCAENETHECAGTVIVNVVRCGPAAAAPPRPKPPRPAPPAAGEMVSPVSRFFSDAAPVTATETGFSWSAKFCTMNVLLSYSKSETYEGVLPARATGRFWHSVLRIMESAAGGKL